MNYKEEKDRHQIVLYPEFLDDFISSNNPVKIINAYVEYANINKCGFQQPELKTGTPNLPEKPL